MSKLNYTEIEDKVFVITFSDSPIDKGKLMMLEDGFYYWFPPDFSGSCVSSWVIKDIANKIDELNKPYEESINKVLNIK